MRSMGCYGSLTFRGVAGEYIGLLMAYKIENIACNHNQGIPNQKS